jgi:hypothetical protein
VTGPDELLVEMPVGFFADLFEHASEDELRSFHAWLLSERLGSGYFSDALLRAVEEHWTSGLPAAEVLRAWAAGLRLVAAGRDVVPLEERLEALRELDGEAR